MIATAYGPPWDAMNGGGGTATGMNLTAGEPRYEIAVDPAVIPLQSFEHVTPTRSAPDGAFLAGDTGGAIIGQHVDIYDWLGRATQDAWGSPLRLTVTQAAESRHRQRRGADPRHRRARRAPSKRSARSSPASRWRRGSTSIRFAPRRASPRRGSIWASTTPAPARSTPSATPPSPTAEPGNVGWEPYSYCGGHGGAGHLQAHRRPDSDRYVYVTEGIIPTVTAGQQVRAGQQIATFTAASRRAGAPASARTRWPPRSDKHAQAATPAVPAPGAATT